MNQLRERLTRVSPYCYLIPCFAVFGMFLFYPFFKTIYLSLFLTDKLGRAKIFVGLKNYADLLRSESFYNSILVTLLFVVVVLGSMLIGLAAAVLCSRTFPGIRAFSTAYALPMAIASSGAAMIFKVILNPTIGVFNKLTGLDINWISDLRYALICVAVLTAWLNSGINFLYFSAGLGNIDESIYERASVDGASSVQKFFRLTLPGLSPILFYTLVVNIIQAFQSFGQVKILTQGGPGESTNLIVYSIYRDAFFNYKFGSAAAQSVVLFLIIMALTLVVGDRLYTDLLCGVRAGVDTALVLSGEATRAQAEAFVPPPRYLFPSVKELAAALAPRPAAHPRPSRPGPAVCAG